MPPGASVCDFCGRVFTREGAEARLLTAFDTKEIDRLERSLFAWYDLHGDGQPPTVVCFNTKSTDQQGRAVVSITRKLSKGRGVAH